LSTDTLLDDLNEWALDDDEDKDLAYIGDPSRVSRENVTCHFAGFPDHTQ